MKSTEGIIEKILLDARERAKEITDKAEFDKALCEKATEKWTSDYLNEQRTALKKQTQDIVDRKLMLSKLDKRKIALATKQEIIEEIIQKVLGELQGLKKRDYLAYVVKLLQENANDGDQIVLSCDKILCKQDLESLDVVKQKNLTFANSCGGFLGGIMLVGKVCDKDLSFKAVIEENRESIISKVTAELFN